MKQKKQAAILGGAALATFQNYWQPPDNFWGLAQLRFSLSSASSVVLNALLWHVGLWLRLRYSNWKIAIDSICISGLNKSGAELEKAVFFFRSKARL